MLAFVSDPNFSGKRKRKNTSAEAQRVLGDEGLVRKREGCLRETPELRRERGT